ncbi:MerR family transcriptional regulator [Photobacterium makurazakiensis]|uniref:MerR family transcriptional regulator n=1 Tax=Photobacterium makurazakiensis TaxID=2910234 RepID=UPI003D109B76
MLYIGEISKRSGASPKAIRLYESIGLLLNIKRRGSYRVYDEGDVKFVKLIKDAQALGVSLSDLKQLAVGHRELDWPLVIELLSQKQHSIDEEVLRLTQQKEKIEGYRKSIQQCLGTD